MGRYSFHVGLSHTLPHADLPAHTTSPKPPVGTVIGPFEIADKFVVAQVSSKLPSHIRPLEEVQDRVTRAFENHERLEMARVEIERIYAQIQEGKTLEQAAPSQSIRHAGPFSETTATGGATSDPAFLGTVFVLPEGKVSPVMETRTGFAIARVDEKIPVDEEQYEKEKVQIRFQLLLQKQQAAFSMWFNLVYEAAKIEDYRDRPIT
jgi:parvulin-like peptidyl-prolyl isomerase